MELYKEGHQVLAMKALTKVFEYPFDIQNNREFSIYISLNILDLTDGLDLIEGEILNNIKQYMDTRFNEKNIPIQSLQCLLSSTFIINKDISNYAQKLFDYTLDLITKNGVDESYEPNSYSDQRNAASASIILYLLLLKYKNQLKTDEQLLHQKLIYLLEYTNLNIHESGGFTMIHDNEIHGGGASLVVLTIQNIQKISQLMNIIDLQYKQFNIENIKFYLCSRHFITFNSRPNKDECLCYLFWIYGAIKLLNVQDIIDIEELRQNTLKLQYEQKFSIKEQAILKFQKSIELKNCRSKMDFATFLYKKYGCIRTGFLQNMEKPDLMHSFAPLAFLIDSDKQNNKSFDYSVFMLKNHLQQN